jgi:hypothetical protein
MHVKELSERKILSERELETMFSNIQEILPINQQLLGLIVSRRDDNPVVDCLGDLFLTIVKNYFRLIFRLIV